MERRTFLKAFLAAGLLSTVEAGAAGIIGASSPKKTPPEAPDFYQTITSNSLFDFPQRHKILWANGLGTTALLTDSAFFDATIMSVNVAVLRELQIIFLAPGNSVTWSAMPNAQTEFLGTTSNRTLAIITNETGYRFYVNVVVAGAAGSTLRVQYSFDQVSWTNLATVPIDSIGLQSTGSVGFNLNLGTVFLRIVGQGGDGVVSPQFGIIALEVTA